MYSIRFDPDRRVFHLLLKGFWPMATVVQFAADLRMRTDAERARHGRFAMLSDASDFPIQSAEVSQQFKLLVARGVETNAGPTAIVVASHLNKLQAERIFRAGHAKVFLRKDEASRWLDGVWP